MTAPRQTRTRLADVARAAGVSVSTASLVFSGKGPVSAATAQRVKTAATELGFSGPDPLASSLRAGRSGVVGVLVDGRLGAAIRDPFAVSVLDGIAEVLDTVPAGLLLLAQDSANDPEAVLTQLSGIAVDAVIFSLCGPTTNPAVAHLAARGIPMIGTGAPRDDRVTQLTIDERGASATATAHLRAAGHRRLAMVAMPLSPGCETTIVGAQQISRASYADATDRVRGFRDVAGRAAPIVMTSFADVEQGRTAAGLLLDQSPTQRPTGIVAQSDLLAAGVIHAALERGLRVPEDLSVVGFDGVDLPWLPTPLTTIDQQGQRKGRRLAEMALATISGETVADETLPVTLRVGATTGPPPLALPAQ